MEVLLACGADDEAIVSPHHRREVVTPSISVSLERAPQEHAVFRATIYGNVAATSVLIARGGASMVVLM